MYKAILPAAALLAAVLPAQGTTKPSKPARAMRLVPAGKPTTDPDELRAKRIEKLKKLEETIFQHATWVTDYDAARAQAAKEGKWILTYFTRSYAP